MILIVLIKSHALMRPMDYKDILLHKYLYVTLTRVEKNTVHTKFSARTAAPERSHKCYNFSMIIYKQNRNLLPIQFTVLQQLGGW